MVSILWPQKVWSISTDYPLKNDTKIAKPLMFNVEKCAGVRLQSDLCVWIQLHVIPYQVLAFYHYIST